MSGARLQLPRESKQGQNRRSSHSSKSPNRPYGGVVTARATRRSIIRATRRLHE